MKLNWSKENISKRLDELFAKEKLTDYDKELMDFFYDYLFNKKVSDEEDCKSITISNKELLEKLRYLCAEFQCILNSLPKASFTSLITQLECLRNMYIYSQQEKMKTKNVTNQDLFDLSYKIYGEISPYFSRYLDYIYKNKLVNVSRKGLFDESFCYLDFSLNEGYAYIGKCFNSSMEATYNHELAHAITAISNTNIFESYYRETHSIYMNLYTDKKLYEDTKNSYYLMSYYDYIVYLQEVLTDLSYIFALIKCKDLTRNNIEKTFGQIYDIEFKNSKDFNTFFSELYSDYADELDITFSYLISGTVALHMLDQDEDKSKKLYTNSALTGYDKDKQFLKLVDMNLKDPYYATELFNRVSCDTKNMVRKKV